MSLQRRKLLTGLLAMPAVIRTPGLLMAIKKIPVADEWPYLMDGIMAYSGKMSFATIDDEGIVSLRWVKSEWEGLSRK